MSLEAIFATDLASADRASFERLRGLSDSLARAIDIARALADSGRRVDLSGLGDAIGRLCAGALDLSPETGREARPLLIAVLCSLDGATAAFRRLEEEGAPLAS